MRTWLSIARGRAAGDVYSDSKWKWMTTDCPGMGWKGELSSGWGTLAGLARSLKMSFVTLLLFSPFSWGKKPQQAGARTGEVGRSGGRGLNRAVCASPAAVGNRAKALACICSWRGAAVSTLLCMLSKEMPSCADEDGREHFCCGSWILCHSTKKPQFGCSPEICFFGWRRGMSTHRAAKQRN